MSVTKKRITAHSLLMLALTMHWAPGELPAQEQELSEIRTLAVDSGVGLVADLTLIRSDERRRRLGPTGQNGTLMLDRTEPCDVGMVLVAQPGSGWYKQTSKNVECAGPEIVMLQRAYFATVGPETDALLRNIDYVLAEDDRALAALLYNDLAEEVAPADAVLSDDYAERAAYAWANATGFRGEPLGQGGGKVLAPEFVAHVGERQQSLGLERSGRLDYETLAAEADHEVFWFRHSLQPEPSTVPTRSEPVQCPTVTSNDINPAEEASLVVGLIRAAEEKERLGEYGNAALLFNEAHAHVRDETTMAFYTERRVYENVGRVLDVRPPVQCDPIQRRFVMTPAMVDAVRAQQRAQPTGVLDYRTLRSLGDIDVGTFLARQPRPPG